MIDTPGDIMRDGQTAGIRDVIPLLRPYTLSITIALLVGMLGSAVAAVQPQVISSMVDSFDGKLSASQIAAVAGLLICSVLLASFREFVVERAGERFAFDTRKRLIRHIYRLPISRFDAAERADLVSRVTNDVSEVRSILSSGFIDIVVSGVTVVISVWMMLLIDPVLVAVAVATLIVVLLLIFSLGMKTKPAGLRVQNELGRLAGTVSRSIGSIRTVKAALAVESQTTTAVSQARQVLDAGLRVAGLRAWIQSVSGLSVQVLLIAVVGLGALRVASGAISTGQLSAFVMYLVMLLSPAVIMGGVMSELGEALGALSRILEVEAWPREPTGAEITGGSVSSEGSPNSLIEFKGVSFSYPGTAVGDRNVEVLRDVSFAVERGSTTALVGPSGAGKSTVIALIERFYTPSSGMIHFDGVDVRSLSRERVRSSLAYVDQDAALISGTVRDNLCLNRRTVSDAECAGALLDVGLIAKETEAENFLRKEVGELGLGVSGGERQRLAVARALLAGAPVLLLDEVTSNLDSRNEGVVVDALRRRHSDRTLLVVAHRLSTVINADRILLFDGGRLLDCGSHEELFSRSKLYRDLAKRQMIG